jgi:hypothetical protein
VCFDTGSEKRVDIDKMVGYAVATRFLSGKTIWYCPIYFTSYSYKRGEKARATYYSCTDEERLVRKNSKYGGFYFFPTIKSAEKLKGMEGEYGFDYVILRCAFKEVFEKGLWYEIVAYRAKFRTILEEV